MAAGAADHLELAHLTGSLFHCNPKVAETIPDYPALPSASTTSVIIAAILGFISGLFAPGGSLAGIAWAELWAALLVDTGDPPQDCCQYGLDAAFRVRLWAALGCPRGHLYNGTDADTAGARFQSVAVGDTLAIDDDFAIDICKPSSGSNFSGWIFDYLVPGSAGGFQWSIPTDCSSESSTSGAQAWT